MSTNQCDIGLIGLAVMGENLVLNMESKGFTVAVFNRTWEVTEKFAAERAKGKNIQPTRTVEELIGALQKPRKVMMMIKAGKPVDMVIGETSAIMNRALGFDATWLAEIVAERNQGDLETHLTEAAPKILRKNDP